MRTIDPKQLTADTHLADEGDRVQFRTSLARYTVSIERERLCVRKMADRVGLDSLAVYPECSNVVTIL